MPVQAPDYQIAARLERLPMSAWHVRMGMIFGAGWFCDSFDALTIAYVLPVLVGLWKLTPVRISGLIAIGFAGQALGSILFGSLAERYGRRPIVALTLALFSLSSLACAWAWSFTSLLTIRLIQGLGLGGEIPVANSYMNEISKAANRGRFILACQLSFHIGLTTVGLAGTWIVPNLGWRWMFAAGAVPGILILPALAWLPESPRWLAGRGRIAQADRVLTRIEGIISRSKGRPLPPIAVQIPTVVPATTHLGDLFKGIYRRRTLTLWALWFCAYLVNYGLGNWLPTIYRTVYKLSLKQSLNYSFIVMAATLVAVIACVCLIDFTGRKPWITVALILGAVPLFALKGGASLSPVRVLVLVSLAMAGITSVSLILGMYTAENYPTHMRAMGGGIAAAWLRIAAMVGPYVVGLIMPRAGVGDVFVTFAVFSLIGGVICALFATETSGRVIEELSPVL